MKLMVAACVLWCLSWNALATTLDDIRPHSPTSQTWSEQWFYYLNDPHVGYFKISAQTYLTPEMTTPHERGYLHVVYAPIGGPQVVIDRYFDQVELAGKPGSEAFRFRVAGLVDIDQTGIRLSLPDLSFELAYTGAHRHYASGENPGQNPFGWIGDLPGVAVNYFVYTLGTPSTYQFQLGNIRHQGQGVTYLDKGWFDAAKSQGFIFVGAFTPQHQLMLTGGSQDGSPLEIWVGRMMSEAVDWRIGSSLVGLSVTKESDACRGYLKLTVSKLGRKMEVEASSDLTDFYLSAMPSKVVFGQTLPIMKSMNAQITAKVYHWGKLVDEMQVPQGLLEFSGSEACPQL
ncbi:hypothetical protein [Photobacterium sp. 1_MG-2023]|uniref:hypothetical protein n=1 Tax=Photobacterium sp. 1_MG-2023 TaxID=3062646 RepID=UPI0026E45A5C|nr:hypothetical protein [Photobacterium sp. 1_MG-2023]MDO6705694.1 hypothetical protein [Photobacterium sp. 1_MG-2023]